MQSERVSTRRLSTQNAEPRCFTGGGKVGASASFSLKRMNIHHVSFDAVPTTMHGSSLRGERLQVCRTHVSPGAPAAGSITIPAKPLQLRGHAGSCRPAAGLPVPPYRSWVLTGHLGPYSGRQSQSGARNASHCHVGSDCICIRQNRMQV